ncbi:hypothetical protein BH10CYA1_BH10CYA1_61310 [soil metagenome]
MKKRNLLSGLFLAAILSLGLAGTANANDYTDTCANFPNLPGGGTFDGNGNVDINQPNCTLNQAVTATGYISIKTTGGAIITQGLTSGSTLFVESSSTVQTGNLQAASDLTVTSQGTLTTGTITSTAGFDYIRAFSGDITAASITAGSNYIQAIADAGKITVSGATNATNPLTQIFYAGSTISLQSVTNSPNGGDVRIFANNSSGASPFTIGTSSTNGVVSITNKNSGFIYISNGSSTGGITYSGNNKLDVSNASGAAGRIVLDGNGTKITLSGTLSADGASGRGSGVIDLFGSEVVLNSATVSANSPSQTIGFINFVTDKITNSGTSTISINGNGPFPNYVDLSLFPTGSYSVTATPDPAQSITEGAYQNSSDPLVIGGSGTLNITANGNNNGIKVVGNPLSITVATKITNNGNHNVVTVDSSDGTNPNTLTLSKAVEIHSQNTAANQTANLVEMSGTTIPTPGGNIWLDTSGLTGGAGGNILLSTGSGTIPIGGTGNNFRLTANGSSTGGKGGNITLGGGATKYSIKNANGILASALGGNGDGGTITLAADTLTNATGAASTIAANGFGTGNGGKVSLTLSTNITLSSAATAFALEAKSGTTGNGGEIDVTANNVTIDSAKLTASAATNGKGGTINLKAFAAFKLTAGNIKADGVGANGLGGNISVTGDTLTFSGTGKTITANGASTQKGGNITVKATAATAAINVSATDAGGVSLSANGGPSGSGGVIDVQTPGTLTVNGTNVLVTAGGNGDGGTINFHDLGTFTLKLGTNLSADAAGTGFGGKITIAQNSSTNPMTLVTTLISAGGAYNAATNQGVVNISSPGAINASSMRLFAKSTAPNTNGGQILITGNTSAIDVHSTILDASAQSGNGTGGTVQVTGNAGILIDHVSIKADGIGTGQGGFVTLLPGPSAYGLTTAAMDTVIEAVGGANGLGGHIVLGSVARLGNDPNVHIFVNSIVQASAGQGISAVGAFGGYITINGVTCQKTFTGLGYPTAYWNCVNPGSPSATDGLPAQDLSVIIPPTGLTPQLVNNKVTLYVLANNAAFFNFFGYSQSDPTAGITFTEVGVGGVASYVDSTVFEQTSLGALTNSQLEEVTIHEHGHAIDFSGGVNGAVNSGSNAYTTALSKDDTYLNNAGAPCRVVGGVAVGPFNNVIDYSSGAQFCTNNGAGNALNNPSKYGSMTNTQIAASSQPGIFGATRNQELFAQTFAQQTYVQNVPGKTTGLPLLEVVNGLFRNGYYGCIATVIATGTNTVPQNICH